ncbi:DcaP family trimeric outer membrane transporter [Amphritea sp.]|uniref:DcaP family trimeric outer membrane transporter n=1 Tax=Amphritea sp. TaxID=1872502 RepID=UPI0025C53346|nr:DcaP family trimeric outer membrane transporter [Amphritea sp.]
MNILKIKKNSSGFIVAGGIAFLCSVPAQAMDFKVGNTEASAYGYVKLDMTYDVDSKLGNSSGLGAAARLDNVDGQDGHFQTHVYQSRIGLKTVSPVEGGNLKTVLEGDFYGSGGVFRLRHAYGEWNNVLAGQTWSNFGGFVAGTPLVDFSGPSGRPVAHRQPQLRYTQGNASFALEDSSDKGGVVSGAGAQSKLPDFTMRYTDKSQALKYSVSGVLRHLKFDDNVNEDSALGWGAALETSLAVSDSLTLRAGIAHGKGVGGYLDGNPKKNPAYFDTTTSSLETIKTSTGTIGASLKVGPGAINAAYSQIVADLDPSAFAASDNDKLANLWVNYIWSPADKLTFGVEAGYHQRRTVGDDEGKALRLQGMVQYAF